uniref:Uncharacterized protein n=1 Tax=Tanacetum cinerariifolium TaxID=118510 RepID=A0A6L2N8I4_TANCI|nr:hypothetical protein [Tanacetum cinerariifolium]
MDESVAEDIPAKEPRVGDEEADVQRALEESMKSMYDVPRGPLLPVVIMEPESGKLSTALRGAEKGQREYSKEYYEEVVPRADVGGQGEGQTGPDPGQARPDPSNAEASQPMPSPVVHAGSDRFTTTAYPKVQENLKLTVEEQVLLEEPASSSGTLSFLQHLTKDLSFGDLFFSDKPSEADNDKATAETKAESMVPKSPKVHQLLKVTATETTTTTTITLLPPPYQQQQRIAKAMMMKRIDELEHIMANLIQENKRLEQRDLPEADMKEILHQRPSGASGSSEAYGSSQVPPPPPTPPPPSTNQEGQSKGSASPSSSKIAASAEYQAWTTTDIRLRPSISLTPADLQMDKDMAPNEQAQSSDDEDITPRVFGSLTSSINS